MKEALSFCLQVGVQVWIYANPFRESVGQTKIEELAGINFITFPTTRLSEHQRFLKRCFDLVVSAGLLILFSPIMLAAAILIKVDFAGPIIFRQERVGLNGRRFTLYKFRSMIVGAQEMKAELSAMNELEGPVFKIRNDPRVTRIGRFLRRTSVDELPQLFNVLMGHMSIVGPRPPLREEVEMYEVWQRRRLSMKPGLTCLWQVNGRNKVDFHAWMELDLNYIDNWSWPMDLNILLRTVPAMLKGQ
jgi:exopolysaccharide biosynthesis polyprenyl glycosylphosphotransferase